MSQTTPPTSVRKTWAHSHAVMMFADKYSQPDGPERSLGQGGASVNVERCFSRATGAEFAAKRLSAVQLHSAPVLLRNELLGLTRANDCAIQRVIKLVEAVDCPSGDTLLVMELVKGIDLQRHRKSLCLPSAARDGHAHEQHVLKIAAQLLQTIHSLHEYGEVCHLDISSANIMLRQDSYEPWDQVRLVDFGFCQRFTPTWLYDSAYLAQDNVPIGATPAYAAPEVLTSLQLQCEGADENMEGIGVNGGAADYWSIGVVLYELLTGQLPFDAKASTAAGTAPAHMQSEQRSEWESCQATRSLQQSWIDACNLVLEDDEAQVQHPLLDRVRHCSSNPDQAALFFKHILSPTYHERKWCLFHAWCKDTIDAMDEDTGVRYGQPQRPDTDETSKMPGVVSTSRTAKFAAALLSCCSCKKPPKVQEEDEGTQPSLTSRSTHTFQHYSSKDVFGMSQKATAGRAPVESKAGVPTVSPGKKVVRWLKSAVLGKAKKPTRTADLSTLKAADGCSLIPAVTSSVTAQPLPDQLQAKRQQLSQHTITEHMLSQQRVKGKPADCHNVHSDAAVVTLTAAASVQPQPSPGSQMLSSNVSMLQQLAEPSDPSGVLNQSPAHDESCEEPVPSLQTGLHRGADEQPSTASLLQKGKQVCQRLLGKAKVGRSARQKASM